MPGPIQGQLHNLTCGCVRGQRTASWSSAAVGRAYCRHDPFCFVYGLSWTRKEPYLLLIHLPLKPYYGPYMCYRVCSSTDRYLSSVGAQKTTHKQWFLDSPLSWALEPEFRILMLTWSSRPPYVHVHVYWCIHIYHIRIHIYLCLRF